jgi:ribonuclease Y
MEELYPLILAILSGVFVGIIISIFYNHLRNTKNEKNALGILEKAAKDAERMRKEAILEAKEEAHKIKIEADRDIKNRKAETVQVEKRLNQRENNLEKRDNNLQNRENLIDQREKNLNNRHQKLQDKEVKLEKALKEQLEVLEKIASLTVAEAKDQIMSRVEEDMEYEIASFIKQKEEDAELEADKRSKELMALAMQKYASEVTNEVTVSTVDLPNDDIKGKIIGREGRNIRTFEALTGVDLIIDDTPDVVVLSGFDPVRREVAKLSLEKLIKEGRINPTRIEDVVEQNRKDIEKRMREIGEETCFELGIKKPHQEIIKLIGRLSFRTSYGQSALQHSKEVAFLSGILAAEIGENQQLAKRAGLLHDIGKAIDHEADGSHVELGYDVARRYRENSVVLNSIVSHHGNEEADNTISVIVAAADALSAARPGARSDSLQNYIKRLEKLETIASSYKGVDKAFALQAGREVRIIVKPDVVDDVKSHKLARDIKEKIENDMQYPGTIKVTVIRETRAEEVAR